MRWSKGLNLIARNTRLDCAFRREAFGAHDVWKRSPNDADDSPLETRKREPLYSLSPPAFYCFGISNEEVRRKNDVYTSCNTYTRVLPAPQLLSLVDAHAGAVLNYAHKKTSISLVLPGNDAVQVDLAASFTCAAIFISRKQISIFLLKPKTAEQIHTVYAGSKMVWA